MDLKPLNLRRRKNYKNGKKILKYGVHQKILIKKEKINELIKSVDLLLEYRKGEK